MISINKNKKIILSIVLLVVLLVLAFLITVRQVSAPDSGQNSKEAGQDNSDGKSTFDKNAHSLDDPNSIWVVVNKKRPIPDGFAPSDLDGDIRRDASKQLDKLIKSAQSQGLNLYVISGFRSFDSQTQTYNSYVNQDGQASADTYSARPGHSEHQTGLAVDLGSGTCNLDICFAETKEGKWLAKNAYQYGFIVRYLKGKEPITGYQYEPWHLRYVGFDLAKELYSSKQTIEEFFGLPAAPSY